ncbi:hypothetical protein E2C01_007557 [Portunus trituberculatus]|uniref:Uncharacterized protein n=1 Tax=Portunus trituberculatus TaxID=210409 RepID=A0A5B7D0S0_PORTR|nr:hypothetical protein [Portunus trituberculatus]
MIHWRRGGALPVNHAGEGRRGGEAGSFALHNSLQGAAAPAHPRPHDAHRVSPALHKLYTPKYIEWRGDGGKVEAGTRDGVDRTVIKPPSSLSPGVSYLLRNPRLTAVASLSPSPCLCHRGLKLVCDGEKSVLCHVVRVVRRIPHSDQRWTQRLSGSVTLASSGLSDGRPCFPAPLLLTYGSGGDAQQEPRKSKTKITHRVTSGSDVILTRADNLDARDET